MGETRHASTPEGQRIENQPAHHFVEKFVERIEPFHEINGKPFHEQENSGGVRSPKWPLEAPRVIGSDEITFPPERITRRADDADPPGASIDGHLRLVQPVEPVTRRDRVRPDQHVLEIPPSVGSPRIGRRNEFLGQADAAAPWPDLNHDRGIELFGRELGAIAIDIAIAAIVPCVAIGARRPRPLASAVADESEAILRFARRAFITIGRRYIARRRGTGGAGR